MRFLKRHEMYGFKRNKKKKHPKHKKKSFKQKANELGISVARLKYFIKYGK